jgi:large subunit ribosomal protein L25
METVKLKADNRDTSGKGAARQMRAKGFVPAVFYGRGVTTRALAISPTDLTDAVSGEMGVNALIDLQMGEESVTTLMADYQVHPVTRALLHVDFVKIDAARRVNVSVPLRLVGKPKGIVMGGRLQQVYRSLQISCLPGQIPAAVEHDVGALEIEEIVRVSDLKLPDGVAVRMRPSVTVAGLYGSRNRAAEDEAAAEPGAEAAKKEERK